MDASRMKTEEPSASTSSCPGIGRSVVRMHNGTSRHATNKQALSKTPLIGWVSAVAKLPERVLSRKLSIVSSPPGRPLLADRRPGAESGGQIQTGQEASSEHLSPFKVGKTGAPGTPRVAALPALPADGPTLPPRRRSQPPRS